MTKKLATFASLGLALAHAQSMAETVAGNVGVTEEQKENASRFLAKMESEGDITSADAEKIRTYLELPNVENTEMYVDSDGVDYLEAQAIINADYLPPSVDNFLEALRDCE